MQSTKGNERAELLLRLAQLGGKDVLAVVTEEAESEDGAVRDAAIRVLTDWPEVSALAPILALFKRAQGGTRLQALRGYLRLVRGARMSPEEVFSRYTTALEAASSNEEKSLLLEAFAHLKTQESLRVTASFLQDEALQQAAAAAVIQLILPRRSGKGGLSGGAAVEALEKAIALTQNDGDRKRAAEYLAKIR